MRDPQETHTFLGQDAVANDSGAAFREIGLDPRAGWITSAVMYGTGGAIGLFLNFFVPGFDWAWQALAAAYVAVLASPVMLWASTRFAPDGVSAHFRMTFGLALMAWVIWFDGDVRGAIWPILMFTILAPAFLHRARAAYIYAALSVIVIVGALVISSETPARVVVALSVILMLTVGIITQQQGLRRVAILNRRLSLIDPLTGVANMRLLRERLQSRIDQAGHGSPPVCVLAVDLDKFKLVNDRHNHTVGDRMIRAVAQAILRTVRDCDLVARRGGDEFYIVTDQVTLQPPMRLIERLKEATAEARLQICVDLPPSVTIGFAELKTGESLDSLLTRADDAVQCEKRASTAGERRLVAKNDDASAHLPSTKPVIPAKAKGPMSASRSAVRAPQWTWAAVIYALLATLGFSMLVGGLAPELAGPVEVSLLASLAALAIWCFGRSRSRAGLNGLRAANLLGLALVSGIVFGAGAAGPDFADMLMVPIIYQYIFERRAIAAAWLVVTMMIFTAALVMAEYPYSTARVITTFLVLAVAGGRLADTRVIIKSYIKASVTAAELDPLTGIANVRGLRMLIDKAMIGRADMLLVLFAVDLDDFKQVNDKHDYQVGDATLKATAEAIEKAIGEHGSVARRGGDEFSAVCDVGSFADAANLAIAISHEIELARSAICDDVLPTASVAFVGWREGESASEFLVRADDELHRTKAAAYARRAGDRALHGADAS